MCGICGVLVQDGAPVSPAALTAMTGVLGHRGPEAVGIFVDPLFPGLGIGHTRLRILDLSEAADQPMASDDSRVQLTFNGEIYNHRELRRTLEAVGVRFRTRSDTEVLLRLYEMRGEEAATEIDGMFAFALWDGRRRRLLLGRDRAGKKPLFYYQRPGFLVFASEIKALLQHPEVPVEIDADALPQFFVFGYVPCPRTLYRGVRQVPPGHLLSIGPDGVLREIEYWDVPLVPEGERVVDETVATAQLRELLTAAVERRLVADVPIGAFLSGGIDSSIVVGLTTRLRRSPVRTFSIGFADDPTFDETDYAQIVAKRFGTIHTKFVVEPNAVDLISRLVWHHDGPFADSSAIPTYILSRLTREHVTVALNGDGGDELFAGYLRFGATLWSERLPGFLRALAGCATRWVPDLGSYRSPVRRLKKLAGGVALPFDHRLTRWTSVFFEDLPRLMPEIASNGHPWAVLALLDGYLERARHAPPLDRLLYLNFKTYLLDDLLVKMDRCSMAHALETRSPFLDTRLIEFAFRLPETLRLRRLQTKYLLRRAFVDLLPREIVTRGKMGFGVPLRKWFQTDLREFLCDHLLAPGAELGRFLDGRYVRALCDEHFAGKADHSHRLWTLLTFEVWLQALGSWRPSAVG